MASFHPKCGKRVTLLNNNTTAVRSDSEFNHGIVLSNEPLVSDCLFEVRIDRKVNSWSGNVEIGVTSCHPDTLELPAVGVSLRHGSWVMSGNSILKDGIALKEFYGRDLDKLNEGDRLGVMRTSNNELLIFINGISQGVAAKDLPTTLYAVIDMYGKCVQVSIFNAGPLEHNNDDFLSCGESSQLTLDNEVTGMSMSLASNLSELSLDLRQDWNVSLNLPIENANNSNVLMPASGGDNMITSPRDRLRFHVRCGSLVKLTANYRSAERRRPLDEFNNGVVMTNRPLQDDELFEIRIDRLVEKWSGSIEVGVTTHNPATLEFPATMTNMRSGTIMMSGCGILTNGKGTRREYGEFNLDELREGDRVGMMRKSNGNLHYFINGLDQGIAAFKVAHNVWGVIDLYGMTIKVTIVDKDERESQNLITRRNTLLRDQHLNIVESQSAEIDCYDRLMFHPNCGAHADVINNGRTAHRPNAVDDFNNGVVLTSRPLKTNEQFEVRLDKVVAKWAGSIEIGVTTHSPTELEFPFTMTNVRSGTWMMTGNGVMHNGTTVIDQYGQNLDRLQVGDRVGVIRKENGTLHFFVNGIDQGPAATNVPERVYGVIDLYGQAAQATIQDALDYSPDTMNSCVSNTTLYSDLRFHHISGKNARISNNGLTASRPRALAEFNDAIVFSNRPLREEELFEIALEKMVDRWSGSIELGLSAVRPEELELPSTATDLEHDTWMLSGAVVMENGVNLKNGYKLDLDTLSADSKIGVLRHADGMLHYFLNGVDQGPACRVSASSVYAVVDLYGQCAQVTIIGNNSRSIVPLASPVQSEEPTPASLQASIVHNPAHNAMNAPQPLDSYLAHKFADFHGKNIVLSENNTIATRIKDNSQCFVFTSHQLNTDELFEIEIMSLAPQYAGSMKFGVTTINIADTKVQATLSSNILLNTLMADWYVTGNDIYVKSKLSNMKFCPSLEWLRVGDRIGIKRSHDGTLRILINLEEMAIIANNVPEGLYGMVMVCGRTSGIHITSFKSPPQAMTTTMSMSMSPLASLKLHDSLELVLDPPSHLGKPIDVADGTDVESISETDRYEFYEVHGRNIEILSNRITARRVASYNQGVVIVSRPLIKGQILEIKVEKINEKWTSSLMLGIVCIPPCKVNFSVTTLHGFKKHCWIISSDWLSINGIKIKSNYGIVLDKLTAGSVVGLLLSETGRLFLYVDGVNLGPLPAGLPTSHNYHAVFDLYGQCEQITILNNQCDNSDLIEQKTVKLSNQLSTDIPSTSGTDNNQQFEKADLESHEKETHNSDSNLAACSSQEPPTQSKLMIVDIDTTTQIVHQNIQPPLIPVIIQENHSQKCEYLKECLNFKNSLVLPEEFFSSDEPICYCSNCYYAGNETYLRKGDPPEEYSIPFGWTKFLLKCPASTNVMTEKWHVAFYGTKLNVIRAILDRRQPLTKEQQEYSNLLSWPIEKGESSSSQIVFSPCLEYATSNIKHSYIDKCTSNKIQVTAAFQLLVRPGSYSINQGSESNTDESSCTSSTTSTSQTCKTIRSVKEWYTKETGAIVLNSLLLKLETF